MGLETVTSKSARPDNRPAILHAALLQRRAELRNSWQRLITAECLKQLGSTAARVSSFLSGQNAFYDWQITPILQWAECDASLPECLISVGVGESLACRPSAAEPAVLSSGDFRKLSGKDRVDTLCVRYRCPLNIGAESESEIAEELLRQLMVVDRAKLKAEAEIEVDDILLKLNLTGVRARLKRDLRFLDALNCFYELPLRSLVRLRRNPHLLAAWLCIYAQLLCTPEW
jgi:hypothetical protein